mmetsp:Transcript_40675/g.107766  ORF Transcript_40675/g.107766 Transcript_40675/m.107766 type:complete len:249 (-) Transcript_40675:106-852(-)
MQSFWTAVWGDKDGSKDQGLGEAQRGSADPFVAAPGTPNRVYRERVLVRLYDLGRTFVTRGAWNTMTKSYGAWHTGIEVYGKEWSFGMTLGENCTGVTWNTPGLNQDHSFKETLLLGYTNMSPEEVWKLLVVMTKEWMGCSYHLFTRNCHHFSDEFSRRLGVGGIPPWINDLASSGAATIEFLENGERETDPIKEFFGHVKQTMGHVLGVSPEPLRDEVVTVHDQSAIRDGLNAHKPQTHDPFSVLRG